MRLRKGLIALVATLAAAPALAQDPGAARRGQDSDPVLPPQNEQVPEKVRPDGGDNRTLSDKLEESGGVIKPPSDVDSNIKTVPPEPSPNSTPVIPPPGNAK